MSREVATHSFCLHALFLSGATFGGVSGSFADELIPALAGDARLYEEAGDSASARSLRDLASGLQAKREGQPAGADLTVFLSNDVTDDQKSHLEGFLQSLPEVQSVTFESKEQAFERAKEIFKDSPDLFMNISPDAFPASFGITLKDKATTQEVTASVSNEPGVDLVRNGGSPGDLIALDEGQKAAIAKLTREAACPTLLP